MSENLNSQHISNLLESLAEKGNYTLSEILSRIPALIEFHKTLHLPSHPDYNHYLENPSLSNTTRSVINTLKKTTEIFQADSSNIKILEHSLNHSFNRKT